MAEGLMTWLDKVAMVPSVVMGVTREALELSTVPPARLVETVPVTVPRVVTPTGTRSNIKKTVSMIPGPYEIIFCLQSNYPAPQAPFHFNLLFVLILP